MNVWSASRARERRMSRCGNAHDICAHGGAGHRCSFIPELMPLTKRARVVTEPRAVATSAQLRRTGPSAYEIVDGRLNVGPVRYRSRFCNEDRLNFMMTRPTDQAYIFSSRFR